MCHASLMSGTTRLYAEPRPALSLDTLTTLTPTDEADGITAVVYKKYHTTLWQYTVPPKGVFTPKVVRVFVLQSP